MKSNRTSLGDIAKETGITRMAVSLALRGKPGVSEETRKAVLKAAARLGYEPDPEVSKLFARIRARQPADATACLALLTSGATAGEWKRSITERAYVEGAQARAREYGYRMEEFWLNTPGLTMARLGDIIWNRGIEGVIIAPLQGRLSEGSARCVDLDYSRFSAVEISETIERPDLDRAVHDQYTSMLKCLEELVRLKYRKVGLVLHRELDLRTNGKWSAAYLRFGQHTGAKGVPPLLLADARQPEFDRWLDRHQPDALVSVDRFGLRLLTARGLRIPRDIGYATLDVDGDTEAFPGVSGINQNSHRVGAAAVDIVVAAIQRNQRGVPEHPIRTEVEGSWTPGKSAVLQRTTGRA
jgi:LacI family transcriptional regulator